VCTFDTGLPNIHCGSYQWFYISREFLDWPNQSVFVKTVKFFTIWALHVSIVTLYVILVYWKMNSNSKFKQEVCSAQMKIHSSYTQNDIWKFHCSKFNKVFCNFSDIVFLFESFFI
jgi:hypothetical protein